MKVKTRDQQGKLNKIKNWCFEMINKISKPQVRLAKKKKTNKQCTTD